MLGWSAVGSRDTQTRIHTHTRVHTRIKTLWAPFWYTLSRVFEMRILSVCLDETAVSKNVCQCICVTVSSTNCICVCVCVLYSYNLFTKDTQNSWMQIFYVCFFHFLFFLLFFFLLSLRHSRWLSARACPIALVVARGRGRLTFHSALWSGHANYTPTHTHTHTYTQVGHLGVWKWRSLQLFRHCHSSIFNVNQTCRGAWDRAELYKCITCLSYL